MEQFETQRLRLRPWRKEDLEDFHRYCKDPEVGPNAGWKPHESRRETLEILRTLFIGQPGMFGIVWRASGRRIGEIGLTGDAKREYPAARMLGYAIREEFWNRGIVTEATRAVVDYGFRQLGLALISAYCYPDNHASRRVLEKCGFHYEGTLALCEQRYDGAVLDNECYSLGAAEWSH